MLNLKRKTDLAGILKLSTEVFRQHTYMHTHVLNVKCTYIYALTISLWSYLNNIASGRLEVSWFLSSMNEHSTTECFLPSAVS